MKIKVKKYPASNDAGVPDFEMDVAKLVQNAKAHGLGWCREALYKNKHGEFCEITFDPSSGQHFTLASDAVSCCAVGARYLAKDTRDMVIAVEGNDDYNYENQPLVDSDSAYLVGLGFKMAMGGK